MADRNYYMKVCTLIVKDERVLLLKEKRYHGENYGWNLPKGTFEASDLTLEKAAIRECLEEAGWQIDVKKLLTIYTTEKENNSFKFQYCFLAEPVKEQELSLQEDEDIIAKKWFSKSEILTLREEDFLSSLIYDLLWRWANETGTDLFIYKDEKNYC